MILKPKIKKVNKLKKVNPRRLDKCYKGLTEMIKLAEKCYKGEHLELRGVTPNQVFVEVKWYMCYLYSLEFNNAPLDNLEIVVKILDKEVDKDLLYLVSGIECLRSRNNLSILLKGSGNSDDLLIKYDPVTEKIKIEV